jgi:PhzF family phenazine biosynthesis protein
MRVPFFQIDAFMTRRFAGNPAAVMLLDSFLPDRTLQAIAEENNLPETAFLVGEGSDYRIRWFTPTVEVPLCGHATLASAAAVFERLEPARFTVTFHSASGPLVVDRRDDRYGMNFPARKPMPVAVPAGLEPALAVEVVEVLDDHFNYLAVVESADVVRKLAPDIDRIAKLDRAGTIVTARGDEGYDFVSRYFAPAKGIPEDPVTGGAHCALAPYWAARLGRNPMRAFQASPRGGEILCRVEGERIDLEGQCAFYIEGHAELTDFTG